MKPPPRFSVFLLSHNKAGYVQEAVRSVLDQDCRDFELWIIENSTDDGRTRDALKRDIPEVLTDLRVRYVELSVPADIRNSRYVPSFLLNSFYPFARDGSIIVYLSDDDLLVPGILASVSVALGENPSWDAVYFTLTRESVDGPGREGRSAGTIAATDPRGSGEVDCQVDGGQVAYYKTVLDAIEKPYFPEGQSEAGHSDGTFLEKIAAAKFTFHPLPAHGVIHRHTPISTWTRS